MQIALGQVERLCSGSRRLAPAGHWVVLPLVGQVRVRCGSSARLIGRGELLLLPADPLVLVESTGRALALLGQVGESSTVSGDAHLWLESGLRAEHRLAREALAWLRGRRTGLPDAS